MTPSKPTPPSKKRCPMCGTTDSTDRFALLDEGRGRSGDAISGCPDPFHAPLIETNKHASPEADEKRVSPSCPTCGAVNRVVNSVYGWGCCPDPWHKTEMCDACCGTGYQGGTITPCPRCKGSGIESSPSVADGGKGERDIAEVDALFVNYMGRVEIDGTRRPWDRIKDRLRVVRSEATTLRSQALVYKREANDASADAVRFRKQAEAAEKRAEEAEAERSKWEAAFNEYAPKIEAIHGTTVDERDSLQARLSSAEAEVAQLREAGEGLLQMTINGRLCQEDDACRSCRPLWDRLRAALEPSPPTEDCPDPRCKNGWIQAVWSGLPTIRCEHAACPFGPQGGK